MSRKSRRPTQVPPSPAPFDHSGPDFVTQSDPAAEPCSISRLARIGVYGFDEIESVILAALVTEDPLLLIGECGTGKTFLLNSLSEALGLEHRHYNASLIQFDDLVGFPYPDDAKSEVKFLQTPATVWGAQSVLVDEISRCRPEHQNRLFSLIHERKVQGLPLERLVYRWAAMNPAGWDGGNGYAGSEPLDFALADRFGLVVDAPDWGGLDKSAQERIADPAGEGAFSDDGGELARELAGWRESFRSRVNQCPPKIVRYACRVSNLLGEAGIRISPRRVRMISRSLLASTIVAGKADSDLFLRVLHASLPHRAAGDGPSPDAVVAAHQVAWNLANGSAKENWLADFHAEPSLPAKLKMLLGSCPDPDTGSTAVAEHLARAERDDPAGAASFAFALYPAAAAGFVPTVGAEGIADLGRIAAEVLQVDGNVRVSGKVDNHPILGQGATLLSTLPPARRDRARQLFGFLVVRGALPADPAAFEAEFDECVRLLAEHFAGAN